MKMLIEIRCEQQDGSRIVFLSLNEHELLSHDR
jgi:hypothetical protein